MPVTTTGNGRGALISASDALTVLSSGAGEPISRDSWQNDDRWAVALRDLPLDIRSARLLRLGPGSRIHEHRDYDLGGPQADCRLHIPLLSSPDVDFMLESRCIPMSAGECCFLDLVRPHSVDNWGQQERDLRQCRPGSPGAVTDGHFCLVSVRDEAPDPD